MSIKQLGPMDPDIKERWIKELRSGDYEQGMGALHRVRGGQNVFCCLGVLSHLAWLGGVVEREFNPTTGCYRYGTDDYTSSGVLVDAVRDWSGVDNEFGWYGAGGSLTSDNDEGLTFEQIANVIEEKF